MMKMKMMTLTILFVVWSLVSGCEYTLCLGDAVVFLSVGSAP